MDPDDKPSAAGQAHRSNSRHTLRAVLRHRANSFRYAFAGIRYALGEPNVRIQLAAGILALALGAVFHIRPSEWLALILISFAVLTVEMLNTVVEALVDLISPEYHPLARVAKDVAAGAVLMTSFAAIAIGISIFGPHLLHLAGVR